MGREVTRPTRDAQPTAEDILAEALRATGLTQAAIAYRLGMSRQAVGDRMRGRTRWTTTEMPVVCQLVGLAPGDVIRRTAQQ